MDLDTVTSLWSSLNAISRDSFASNEMAQSWDTLLFGAEP